jgi:predicted transcriptional regulator
MVKRDITVRMDEKLIAAVKSVGVNNDRSRSYVIEKAVQEFVERHNIKIAHENDN